MHDGIPYRQVSCAGRVCGLVALLLATAAVAGAGASASAARDARPVVQAAQVQAERSIYSALDAAAYFVGATMVARDGAVTWSSSDAGESGVILCQRRSSVEYTCSWRARLVQSYAGKADVRFHDNEPAVSFLQTTCANPKAPGVHYPNLCQLNPLPGMSGG